VNKQEFVETLAERCELSKAEAGRTLEAILDSLTEIMADREEVSFTGFGKFMSQRRRARDGVNPQDPTKKIRIHAAYVPKFRPGAGLREAASQAPAKAGAAKPARASRSSSDDRAPAAASATDSSAAEPTPTPAAPGGWAQLGDR